MSQVHEKSNIHNSIYAMSVRHGLTLAIPFLIIGSFALLFNNLPVEGYQEFISSFLNGALSELFTLVYDITLNSLALILTFTISLSYGRLTGMGEAVFYPLAACASYLAFCGGVWRQADYIFNAEWVFTAMCITLLSCSMFRLGIKMFHRLGKIHTIGAEFLFNESILCLFPITMIIVVFAVAGYVLRFVWGDANITNFGSFLFLKLFDGIGGNLPGILLYVLISHGLWFLGIHGTNTLEAVAQRLLEQGVDVNQALIAVGKAPDQIFSKTFLDTFVFLGGCGCALSFAIALGIFSKKSHNTKLAKVALPSALFNISELAVFGYPVILNLNMLIPFILTPCVLVLTSTAAMKCGLVPLVTQSVQWTTPVIISGYQATGSAAGSILQLVNVVVGVLIYMPFVKRSEFIQSEEFKQAVAGMEADMEQGEKKGMIPRYLHHTYVYHYYAQTLALDLKYALQRKQIELYYQPQVTGKGTLHGVEALLRWKHPVSGYISPPVVICLAHESGFLNELTYYLMEKACLDAVKMESFLDHPVYLSVNISPRQLESNDFLMRLLEITKRRQLSCIKMVLEITERSVMEISDHLINKIQCLKESGIQFSMDDFGMGHGSMTRLQENLFDEVKLDGSLVKRMTVNERSRDIIAGITQMADHLHFRVVAEFVETKEEKELLEKLGCDVHQGYYYSRPLEIQKFLGLLQHRDSNIDEMN